MGLSLRVAKTALAAAIILLVPATYSGSDANPLTGYTLTQSSGDIPARFVPTNIENLDVTNHCIAGGGSKDGCVCLIKVLKHELNVRDYRVIAARTKTSDTPRATLLNVRSGKASLDAAPIDAPLDPVIRALLTAPDLNARCETADRFYNPPR